MDRQSTKIIISLFFIAMGFYLGLLTTLHFPLNSFIKPLPIFLLILLSLQGDVNKQTKLRLTIALFFSMIGDIVLTFTSLFALKIGILAFVLAHCAYITLYMKDAQFRFKRIAYFIPVLAIIGLGYCYLFPHLDNMTIPVTFYLLFLTGMVFCAFQVSHNPLLIIIGASLFLLSDFILAINQFILFNTTVIPFLVMVLYYFAQFLLTIGLSQKNILRSHRSTLSKITPEGKFLNRSW